MKRILFLPCLTMIALTSIGQSIDTSFHATDLGLQYKQRSKTGKTAGFVLLGGGLLIGMAGVSTMMSNLFSDTPEGEVAAGAGMAMVIGSIPVFIIAGKNKRKSRLVLQQDKSSSRFNKDTYNQTAIAWKLEF